MGLTVFKFHFFNLVNILNLILKNYFTFKICNVIITYNWTQNYCHIKLRYISSFFLKINNKKIMSFTPSSKFLVLLCISWTLFSSWENVKRGGSLDCFWHQILPSHWSKPWSYDQILDFVWWREDTVQFWLFLILTFKARFL